MAFVPFSPAMYSNAARCGQFTQMQHPSCAQASVQHVAFRTCALGTRPRAHQVSERTEQDERHAVHGHYKAKASWVRKVATPAVIHSAASQPSRKRLSLADLPEEALLTIGLYHDMQTLCRTDACTRIIRTLNQSNHLGPWRTMGRTAYHGLELAEGGVYDLCEDGSKLTTIDWKGRYFRFRMELPTFSPPFGGREITEVKNMDEVAYCRAMIRAGDLVQDACPSSSVSQRGIYIEIEVRANPDNLSLAMVDFQAGGNSSLTFSPDTGAVIREKKLKQPFGKVEGAYVQPLVATSAGEHFQGLMGVYVEAGHVAFLRKMAGGEWESTGFVTDLSWAHGTTLTPCIAFRDEGLYQAKILRVGRTSPVEHPSVPQSYDENEWNPLDWDAEDQ